MERTISRSLFLPQRSRQMEISPYCQCEWIFRLACVTTIIDPSFIDNKPPSHDIPGLMLYTTLFGRQYAPWIDEVESYFSLVHEGVKVTTHSIHCTGLTSENSWETTVPSRTVEASAGQEASLMTSGLLFQTWRSSQCSTRCLCVASEILRS